MKERRTKMAEGEINIDNIIQRLLEGEMSTIELALFSSSTSWTLKSGAVLSIVIESGRQMVAKQIPHLKSFILEHARLFIICGTLDKCPSSFVDPSI